MSQAPTTEDVFQETYDALRRLAVHSLRGERSCHTLQPTALVHEVYIRLSNRGRPWTDRSHFLGIASRAMRQVLVDWARARSRQKRGGPGMLRITFDDAIFSGGQSQEQPDAADVLHFDDALQRLARFDERKAALLELRVFSGLTIAEVADYLEISEATVSREWRAARAWMARFLGEVDGSGVDLGKIEA